MATNEYQLEIKDPNAIKIVFWGPTMAGKTTALAIFHAIRKHEDPERTYQFLKIEDPETGRTLGFDQATFGLSLGQGKEFKYYLFTVPGQDRFKAMRKVVASGLDGLIIILDSERSRWDENKKSLVELFDLLGDDIRSGRIKFQILLNKMDLPEDQRIQPSDVARLLEEAGVAEEMREGFANVTPTSCKNAIEDLKQALKDGNYDSSNRPESLQRIMQPIQQVIREILIYKLSELQK